MDILPPSSRQHVGRTFVVTISIVGLVALCQIGAIAYAFVDRVQINTNPQADAPDTAASPVIPEPEGAGAVPENEMSVLPMRPESIMPSPTTSSVRVSGLIDQAKQMRDAGDTKSAIVKLREAETLSPDNAVIISELATTYEQMGLTDKSFEQWRRVYNMGSEAGALLQLAEMKLKSASGAGQKSDASISGESGLQAGSVMGLIDVRAIELEDPNASKKFKLRVGLKARSGEEIDVRDVIIQVFFYDMLDGQHIVQTNADVSSQWTTVPADWKDDGIEILEVGYLQPLPTEEVLEEREYLGYIVRVYYKGQLEDVRADPVRLLTLFPPPLQVDG